MSLLAICIAELEILKEQLIGLEDCDSNTRPKEEHTLRECVALHKMIIEYVDNLNIVLALPLFIQYTCGCFIICNAILQLTIMKGKTTIDTVTIITYTCVTFSQLAAYHWLGNEVMYKSNNVIEACYLSKWYTLDDKSQKCLLLLMERAKRPLLIKSYSIVYISLESLAVIVRWSYSLFALIKATYS
ncbi:7tm Odorant receptor [Popillia japonica]|uniref:7tm Odorant receptor n=1 Tax=Popillia japonica TaxID=7064 RepID=A0AAW1JH61_POPJA